MLDGLGWNIIFWIEGRQYMDQIDDIIDWIKSKRMFFRCATARDEIASEEEMAVYEHKPRRVEH